MGAGDNKNNPTPQQPNNEAKKDVLKLLEGDAIDAGWRLAGKQFLKMTREPLVAFLGRQFGDEPGMMEKIAAFLDTDLGKALLASTLSMALSMVPEPVDGSEYAKRMARELRVSAMTDVGDVVAELLMGPLRQVIVMYLQKVGTQQKATTPSLPAEAPRVSAPVFTPAEQPVTVGSSNRSTNP